MEKSKQNNNNKSNSCEMEENSDTCNYLRSTWTLSVQTPKILDRVTVVMRSAERVDRIFGSGWMNNETFMNKVHATDMNIPRDAGKHPHVFHFNPPITCIGKYTTKLIARALHNRGIDPSVIYCSPTLRAVQTAHAIAKSSGGARICVEPGLLEPVEWFRAAGLSELPDFCGSIIDKYRVDPDYKPIFTMNEIREMFPLKTQDHCIQRIQLVVQNICGFQNDSPAMIVAHAITMDIASQFGETGDGLTGSQVDECTSYEDSVYVDDPQGQAAKLELGVKYPPSSVLALIRLNESPPSVLQTIPNIIPPLTFGTFCNDPIH